MLTIVTPAADPLLLTEDELKVAIKFTDETRADELEGLNEYIAATLARQCKVAAGGVAPPSLRKERVSETVYLDCGGRTTVKLARRPIATMVSVTHCGRLLDPSEYEYHPTAGLLWRLSGHRRLCWDAGRLVSVYEAGWENIPPDLKLAAAKFAAVLWQESNARDPNLKRVRIEGVSEREYWVPPASDVLVPAEIVSLLEPYTKEPSISA